jgi:hypothetical protein
VRYLESLIGTAAAFCATISYVPQLEKRWETSEAGDLSLKMLFLPAAGHVVRGTERVAASAVVSLGQGRECRRVPWAFFRTSSAMWS